MFAKIPESERERAAEVVALFVKLVWAARAGDDDKARAASESLRRLGWHVERIGGGA